MKDEQERQFTRIHFSQEVALSFQEMKYNSCRIKDLCLGGMFVQGRFKENVGEVCQISFIETTQTSGQVRKAVARVIRADKEGLALEFTSMTFDSYMFLQTTLLYEAKDPFSLSLEFPPYCPFDLAEYQLY